MRTTAAAVLVLLASPVHPAPIHEAVAKGDLARVKVLLRQKDVVNARDRDGRTPLMWAAMKGRTAIAELLIRKGAGVEDTLYGSAALSFAAVWDQVEVASLLLRHGANIDRVMVGDRHTPLTDALNAKARKAALFLIRKGASVNPRTAGGPAPLELALDARWPDVARLLMKKGAKPSLAGRLTPICVYARLGDLAQVRKLLDKGADANSKDKIGRPLLWHAASKPMLELLLSRGANPAAPGRDGSTLMHHLVGSEAFVPADPEVVSLLVKKGADPNQISPTGGTPLDAALSESGARSIAVAVALIRNGADPNRHGPGNLPPLFFAIVQADKPLVEALLANGADINVRGPNGETAVHAAAMLQGGMASDAAAILRLVISKGGDVNARNLDGATPLFSAVSRPGGQNLKAILLENGADLNARDNRGRTLAHTMMEANNREDMEFLLRHGLDINARANDGSTPLFAAARYSGKEYFQWLISKGADPMAKTNTGRTVLFAAAEEDRSDIVEDLIRRGLDVNARNEAGVTPLHVAARASTGRSVPLLIRHGADVNALTKDGRSPEDVARSNDAIDAIYNAGGRTHLEDRQRRAEPLPE